jgi:hypothetical protein
MREIPFNFVGGVLFLGCGLMDIGLRLSMNA